MADPENHACAFVAYAEEKMGDSNLIHQRRLIRDVMDATVEKCYAAGDPCPFMPAGNGPTREWADLVQTARR